MDEISIGQIHTAEIWYVDFTSSTNTNSKIRPVIIIEFDPETELIIALSVTSSERVKRPKGSDISLTPDASNKLNRNSVVDTVDISKLHPNELKRRGGKLSEKDLSRVLSAYLIYNQKSL